MSARSFTPETDARFIALYNEGLTLLEIANRFGVASSTAGEWRDRLGLSARLQKTPSPEKEQICDLWKQGKSAGEIATIIKKTRGSVMGVIYRAGLTDQSRTQTTRVVRTVYGMRTLPPPFTPEQDDALRSMAGEGISRKTAALRLGMHDRRVSDRIKALRLVWTEPKSAADSPWQRKAKPKQSDVARKAATEAGQLLLANATDEPGPNAVRMLDRGSFTQCAWPVGTPERSAEQLCCGEPIAPGHTGIRQSYCAGHGMRAVSKTFVREPIAPRERTVAPVPRREPANDDRWDAAA